MILDTLIGFLLFDGILACLVWLLFADEFQALDNAMAQAEQRRDRAIDEWFQAQDIS